MSNIHKYFMHQTLRYKFFWRFPQKNVGRAIRPRSFYCVSLHKKELKQGYYP